MFYSLPTTTPDERMLRDPIWATWVEYNTDINQTNVLEFASNIIERGFPFSQVRNYLKIIGVHVQELNSLFYYKIVLQFKNFVVMFAE